MNLESDALAQSCVSQKKKKKNKQVNCYSKLATDAQHHENGARFPSNIVC